MKYAFIEAHRDHFSVTRMCLALGVSPSGYYAWRVRGEEHMWTSDTIAKLTFNPGQ